MPHAPLLITNGLHLRSYVPVLGVKLMRQMNLSLLTPESSWKVNTRMVEIRQASLQDNCGAKGNNRQRQRW